VPFTLSHAAAAIPFRRTRLIPSALVAGCFAPDFEHLLRMRDAGAFSHTLPGVFLFDLPVVFIFLWFFHTYVKEPLWAALPASARSRIDLGPRSFSIRTPSHFLLLVVSILLGIGTHLLWDSFTHTDYWPYRHVPLLRVYLDLPILGPRPVWALLQNASSILGLLVIVVWWHFAARSIPPRPISDNGISAQKTRLTLLAAFAVALVAAVYSMLTSPLHGRSNLLAQALFVGMTIFWIEIVIYGFIRGRLQREVRRT
jgi:hypothetical protein